MIFEVYRGPVSNIVRIIPSKYRNNYSQTRINKVYRNPKTKEIVYYPELYERVMTAMMERMCGYSEFITMEEDNNAR